MFSLLFCIRFCFDKGVYPWSFWLSNLFAWKEITGLFHFQIVRWENGLCLVHTESTPMSPDRLHEEQVRKNLRSVLTRWVEFVYWKWYTAEGLVPSCPSKACKVSREGNKEGKVSFLPLPLMLCVPVILERRLGTNQILQFMSAMF